MGCRTEKKGGSVMNSKDWKQVELMKIIVSDDLNLLKDKNQSIDDYELEKKSYKKIIDEINERISIVRIK